MRKFWALSFFSVIIFGFFMGCVVSPTVHTSSEKVFYTEDGIRVGSYPDDNPVVAIFQNRTNEMATITVAGGLSFHKWRLSAGKSRSLRLENMGGEISFLIELDTLPSVSCVLNLDRGPRTRRILIQSDGGFYSEEYRSRRVETPGKMMMEIHNSHLRQFLRERKEREKRRKY